MEDTSCLSWRKSSYSGNGGANCVEAAGAKHVVLVRDTRDSAGPVLRFAPGAWRRFAEKIKRSLASGAAAPERGILPCRGCILRGTGVFLAGRGGRWPGCRRGGVRVSAGAGVGAVGESVVARGCAPSGGERPDRFGGTGDRLWGVPGSLAACRFPGPEERRGIRVCRAESAAPCAVSTVICGGCACTFPVIGAAGSCLYGEAERGLGETWNRAVVFRGRGVPGFPQCDSGLVPLLAFESRDGSS
jgi:hypothetical protein